MNKIKISASLMCANQKNLLENVKELIDSGIDMLHIDILDNKFANNMAMNVEDILKIRKSAKVPIDVHLMVVNPLEYIQKLAEAKADIVFVHVESKGNLHDAIKNIKNNGMKAGIAIKAETPLEKIYPYAKEVDFVKFMCIKTGFKGNPFIPEVVSKINEFNEYIKKNNLNIVLEADGSINEKTIPVLYKAGIRIFVGGSSGLFKEGGFKKNIDILRNSA